MSVQFEWQSELEDEDFVSSNNTPPRRPSGLWLWLITFLLVAIGAYLVYQQLDKRVDDVASAVEREVLAVHFVLRQAAETGDADTFNSFLLEKNTEWGAVEKLIFEHDLWLNRQPLGLSWQPGPPNTDNVIRTDNIEDISLSADLNNATLIFTETYTTKIDGLTKTLALEHIAHYRRSAQGWLLAPPPAQFWGESQTIDLPYLSLSYPQRDARLSQKLAEDLSATVSAICTEADCPPDLHFNIALSQSSNYLLDMLIGQHPIGLQTELKLAAISQIGKPVDAPGYQILLNSYLGHILAAFITQVDGLPVTLIPQIDMALQQANYPSWAALTGVEADISQTYMRWNNLAAGTAPDLFNTLVLSRPTTLRWRNELLRVISAQSYYERAPLKLNALAEPPQIEAVTFNAPLTQAQVLARHSFSSTAPLNLGQVITLTLQSTFEQNKEGLWQLTRPDIESVGETFEGRLLQLRYPIADKALTVPLASRIDKTLSDFCARLVAYDCPSTLEVTFDAAPWRRLEEPEFNRQFRLVDSALVLPTPSLVGQPIDRAGEEALYLGYANQIFHHLMARIWSQQPGDYPIQRAIYRQGLLDLAWQSWPPDEPVSSPQNLPVQLPQQAVQMVCFQPDLTKMLAVKYNPQSNSWETQASFEAKIELYQNKETGDIFIQQSQPLEQGVQSKIVYWPQGDPGQEQIIVDWSAGFSVIPMFNPSANVHLPQQLQIALYNPTGSPGQTPQFYLADLNDCEENGCLLKRLAGYTEWSGNNKHSLITIFSGDQPLPSYFIGNDQGQPLFPLKVDYEPNWFGDNRYAVANFRNGELMISDSEGNMETILDADLVLGKHLFFAADRSQYRLVSAFLNPLNTNEILLEFHGFPGGEISNPRREEVFIIYDIKQDTSREVKILPANTPGFPFYSPQGRWLNLFSISEDYKTNTLYFFDLAKDIEREYSFDFVPEIPFDWSADENWLALMDDGLLRFIAPEFEAEFTVAPPWPGCVSAVWLR